MIADWKAFVGFTDSDPETLRELGPIVAPNIDAIVTGFYDVLLRNPAAQAVFQGGAEQMDRQRRKLSVWIQELFSGRYDDAYVASRAQIGATHVEVGLPQQYTILGMHILRGLILEAINRENRLSPRSAQALDRILALDLSVMLHSYQRHHDQATRQLERAAMEEQVSRAHHMAEIGHLAASLAHEIKNPLAGISGAIQVIGESLPPSSGHQPIVREALAQIKRLDAAVNDLLLYARPSPPAVGVVRVEDLLARIILVLGEEPALQRVRVEHECTPSSLTFRADQSQIEQVLINLILNAAHASPDQGDIRVTAHRENDSVILTVRDEGTGLSSEAQKRAFEPFFTTKARGTGLGLSICRRIVDAHGGSLDLQSTERQGTTVTVTLPHRPKVINSASIKS